MPLKAKIQFPGMAGKANVGARIAYSACFIVVVVVVVVVASWD